MKRIIKVTLLSLLGCMLISCNTPEPITNEPALAETIAAQSATIEAFQAIADAPTQTPFVITTTPLPTAEPIKETGPSSIEMTVVSLQQTVEADSNSQQSIVNEQLPTETTTPNSQQPIVTDQLSTETATSNSQQPIVNDQLPTETTSPTPNSQLPTSSPQPTATNQPPTAIPQPPAPTPQPLTSTNGAPTPASALPTKAPVGSHVLGDGAVGSCTEQKLIEALVAGGEIFFNCGETTIPITTRIIIDKDVVLNGNQQITLNGQSFTGILKTEQFINMTVKGVNFINAKTDGQGGAIHMGEWSNLRVENSRFENNQATSDATACDGGGAIFVSFGGLFHAENSHFSGNRAQNGGAINNLRSGITVLNSTFLDNHAQHSDRINQYGDCGGGGAIYIDGTRRPEELGPDLIILRNNTYIGNTTNNHGGALFIGVRSGEATEVSGSYFENNVVTKVGSMPTSGTGGGIWYGSGGATIQGHTLTISHSGFVNNRADTQGGGVWTSAPANITSSTFVGNSAVDPATLDRDDWRKGNGGGIAVAHQARVNLVNSTIVGNRAGFNGGGIVGENLTAKNTIIANNVGDWYLGLQQNCTHAPIDYGGNLQFLDWHPKPNHVHESNCGEGFKFGDPVLGPLQNGGVLPLQASSSAIDIGTNEGCPPTDQRGQSRPRGNGCDAGAFEFGG